VPIRFSPGTSQNQPGLLKMVIFFLCLRGCHYRELKDLREGRGESVEGGAHMDLSSQAPARELPTGRGGCHRPGLPRASVFAPHLQALANHLRYLAQAKWDPWRPKVSRVSTCTLRRGCSAPFCVSHRTFQRISSNESEGSGRGVSSQGQQGGGAQDSVLNGWPVPLSKLFHRS